MAVVLDRHARRRPYPPGTAAQVGDHVMTAGQNETDGRPRRPVTSGTPAEVTDGELQRRPRTAVRYGGDDDCPVSGGHPEPLLWRVALVGPRLVLRSSTGWSRAAACRRNSA